MPVQIELECAAHSVLLTAPVLYEGNLLEEVCQ